MSERQIEVWVYKEGSRSGSIRQLHLAPDYQEAVEWADRLPQPGPGLTFQLVEKGQMLSRKAWQWEMCKGQAGFPIHAAAFHVCPACQTGMLTTDDAGPMLCVKCGVDGFAAFQKEVSGGTADALAKGPSGPAMTPDEADHYISAYGHFVVKDGANYKVRWASNQVETLTPPQLVERAHAIYAGEAGMDYVTGEELPEPSAKMQKAEALTHERFKRVGQPGFSRLASQIDSSSSKDTIQDTLRDLYDFMDKATFQRLFAMSEKGDYAGLKSAAQKAKDKAERISVTGKSASAPIQKYASDAMAVMPKVKAFAEKWKDQLSPRTYALLMLEVKDAATISRTRDLLKVPAYYSGKNPKGIHPMTVEAQALLDEIERLSNQVGDEQERQSGWNPYKKSASAPMSKAGRAPGGPSDEATASYMNYRQVDKDTWEKNYTISQGEAVIATIQRNPLASYGKKYGATVSGLTTSDFLGDFNTWVEASQAIAQKIDAIRASLGG